MEARSEIYDELKNLRVEIDNLLKWLEQHRSGTERQNVERVKRVLEDLYSVTIRDLLKLSAVTAKSYVDDASLSNRGLEELTFLIDSAQSLADAAIRIPARFQPKPKDFQRDLLDEQYNLKETVRTAAKDIKSVMKILKNERRDRERSELERARVLATQASIKELDAENQSSLAGARAERINANREILSRKRAELGLIHCDKDLQTQPGRVISTPDPVGLSQPMSQLSTYMEENHSGNIDEADLERREREASVRRHEAEAKREEENRQYDTKRRKANLTLLSQRMRDEKWGGILKARLGKQQSSIPPQIWRADLEPQSPQLDYSQSVSSEDIIDLELEEPHEQEEFERVELFGKNNSRQTNPIPLSFEERVAFIEILKAENGEYFTASQDISLW